LPDITRFKNLRKLDCDDNYLVSLPELPESLIYLSCNCNNIKYLPALPENLQYLYCNSNELHSLPKKLPANIKHLYCISNKLTYLPALPATLQDLYFSGNKLTNLPKMPNGLQKLHCEHNMLTSMPYLPESINSLGYCFNPVHKMQTRIINDVDVSITIKEINKYNSFRHLFYCVKYKQRFRNWLWEKIRKPKIEKKYNPNYLVANLNEDSDLDMFLDDWIVDS
jgi:Leucine-rich repeat (LRR) protein